MNERLDDMLRVLRAHRFWIEVACTTAIVLIICAVLGRAVHTRADRLEQEAQRLERVLAAYGRWSREFRPASRNESLGWTASENDVRSLGIVDPKGIAVAQMVAHAADRIGLDARVLMVGADTLSAPVRQVAEATFSGAAFGVRVEFGGGIRAAADMIAALPLSVEPYSVDIARTEKVRTTISAFVYERPKPNEP
jgi:hypothetical protein